MYPCTKFQSIRRKTDFSDQISPKTMNKKFFEKINIKNGINI